MARKKARENQATDKTTSAARGVENPSNVQADRGSIAVGGIEIGGDVSGEINFAAGDIVKNINTFHQRALTVAEEAARARQLESKLLAQGIAALVQNLSVRVSEGAQSETPYKGLLPYSLNEAEIFYGRNKATRDLLAQIKQSPLTVLHAESGAGKSSLLQAGVAAQLIANNRLAVYLRPHHADPVEFIKRMFLPELTQAPALAGGSLRDFLRQACGVLGSKSSLYLLLDQFEEFFELKKDERRPFLESLADCVNDPSLNVRWVLALRKEALSDLAELESYGITQFKNTYRLNRLSRAEAREAMIEPARRHGIAFEPALIEHILDTLTTNDEVRPTQLQLVCTALTDDLPAQKTLTLAYFKEHEGGTEGILRDYLKRQLEDLPASEQVLAWKVLRALITSDRHRAVKTYDELSQELKTSGVTKKQFETVLSKLLNRRLLFTQLQPASEEAFELAHDYLIKEIELDPEEQALKAAQELLDQETRTYQRHRTLLTPERLAVIEPYQSGLRFTADSEVLLRASQSAVQQERRASEWRRRITLGISLLVAIVMSLLAFWGLSRSSEATKQAAAANSASTQAVAQQATAQSNARTAVAAQAMTEEQRRISQINLIAALAESKMQRQLDLSSLLSVEAFHRLENFQTRSALLNIVRASPRLRQFLNGHDSNVYSVAFSPDGRLLASGGLDGRIILWNAETGRPAGRPLEGHAMEILSVAFSPDGKTLASGSSDRSIIIWDVETSAPLDVILPGHLQPISSIAFSPDGRQLASGSYDGTIILLDAGTHQPIGQALAGHGGIVWSVRFSPDGKTLASTSADSTIILWDVETHQQRGPTLRGHSQDVFSVVFSPDGKTLASGGRDRSIILWDVQTGNKIGQPLVKHTSYVNSVDFSPDGTRLASGSGDTDVILWDVATQQAIDEPFEGHSDWVKSVTFSPDGKTLASGSQDSTIILWNIEKRPPISQTLEGHTDLILSVAFSPDGKRIASASRSTEDPVILWDLASDEPTGEPLRGGHSAGAHSVAFSPDGKILASGSYDKTIILWDVETRQPIGSPLTDHEHTVTSLAFSPDGKTLASGSEDTKIILWNVETHQRIDPPLEGHAAWVSNLRFSPDGKRLASASGDATLILWNVETHRMIDSPREGMFSVAFSPDGKILAQGNPDNDILLFDTQTYQPIGQPLEGHTAFVNSIAFSPDGKIIASAANDNRTILWDVETHQPIGQPLEGHTDFVKSLAFRQDGKVLVTGSNDKMVILWDVHPPSWIDQLCNRVGRNFTPGEWAQYFPEDAYRKTCEDLPDHPSIYSELANQILSSSAAPRQFHTVLDEVRNKMEVDAAIKDPALDSAQLVGKMLISNIFEEINNRNWQEVLRLLEQAEMNHLPLEGFRNNLYYLYTLCRSGSIDGYAKQVLEYCERAVELTQDVAYVRDGRGLARALAGDYSGAIEDFQFIVENDPDPAYVERRKGWIAVLKTGKNPFTPEVLERLKQ